MVKLPPNEATIRALLALDLYDQAFDELRYAQKVWGASPAIQATIGWIHNRRGDLRAGISAVKRAYPQYMAAGGEKLPIEILKVLFPVEYWPQIRRYSAERNLDPYMMAALIAQESNFTADVRSSANAYGLMQLLPSTGRQYAKSLHLSKRFSISMLTSADTNLKMGIAYFADLLHQFGGGAHLALATYNAGPGRVYRWMSERPGIERDEFIDDIPFPETQNYVKRILGTAEDYRRLYSVAAAVTSLGGRIEWHADGGVTGIPRFLPGCHAFFQHIHDAIRDLLTEITLRRSRRAARPACTRQCLRRRLWLHTSCDTWPALYPWRTTKCS